MGAISELLKKYFTKDSRPAVRCTALQAILQVYKSNKQIHEEEILKTLIIPFVNKLDEEVHIAANQSPPFSLIFNHFQQWKHVTISTIFPLKINPF